MASPFLFKTPAHQIDFPDDATKQAALEDQWNANLDGFTRQGIVGNPWNATNSAYATNYFNPASVPVPSGTPAAQIQWSPFPGRIASYFPNLSIAYLPLADTGYQSPGGPSFPNIPPTSQACGGMAAPAIPYGPYGPRGWQDEYCEWSVTRDDHGNIVRVDFTCENPEYWNSLWMIDPARVLDLYRSTLGNNRIVLEDLRLLDAHGAPVIDPSTGRPAYNPLNKWNSGTVSTPTAGGAMHLTSTPNTLQTEIGLASAATIQRTVGSGNENALICCAQYGQIYRNSDPHIGQVTNGYVAGLVSGAPTRVTLTNPPGLYIQTPNFSTYATKDGTDPSTFWTVVRGRTVLTGDDGNPLPGNFILHAKYEVPASRGYTVSDVLIGGQRITWGGQIARTFLMQILATALSAPAPAAVSCVGDLDKPLAQPLQLFHAAVFGAMSARAVANPVGFAMNLLSNSTLIAPLVERGANSLSMVLTAATVRLGPAGELPAVAFDGGDVTAVVTSAAPVTYAVPGNSYPSQSSALALSVTVAPGAKLGLRDLFLTNFGDPAGAAMPALLNVVPAGAIGK